MKKYRDVYYDISETNINYIVEFYDDTKIRRTGYVELNKAGIIGEVNLDKFAKECIDDEYYYLNGWK